MEPTIKKGDIIFVSKFYYELFEPKKNDVVLFKPEEVTFDKGDWVHRIIAVEDDSVEIRDNVVWVNGIHATYPNIQESESEILVVPNGKVYQKGDNPSTIYGTVDENLIIGKVVFYF